MKAPVLVLAWAAIALLSACGEPPSSISPGDPIRGKIALTQYACNACHMIPGLTGSETFVGKPLKGLRRQQFVAGTLPMNEDNLVRWIMNPRAIDPGTAMPVLHVSERDARDMAAYLLKQK